MSQVSTEEKDKGLQAFIKVYQYTLDEEEDFTNKWYRKELEKVSQFLLLLYPASYLDAMDVVRKEVEDVDSEGSK